MLIELKPKIKEVLQGQVAAGHFSSIEEALTAAVLGVPLADAPLGDLAWAKPYLAEADEAIAQGQTMSEADAFADPERRYGKV